ncbi:hypothetical protein MTO96_014004 [Rhipicephalus appendiculatus]
MACTFFFISYESTISVTSGCTRVVSLCRSRSFVGGVLPPWPRHQPRPRRAPRWPHQITWGSYHHRRQIPREQTPTEGGATDVNEVPQHIEVSIRYITTAQGMLTCLEALGAATIMVMYLLMVPTITYQWYVRVAFLLAFTYSLNNVLIIISGVASPFTQLYLPETLFVVLTGVGVIHCFHSLVNFIK